MNERGDPSVIPKGGHSEKQEHSEIKVKTFGAFEMVMKGRRDPSLGRCGE